MEQSSRSDRRRSIGLKAQRKQTKTGIARLIAVVAVLGAEGAPAQTDAEAPIHWAYGAYFGTGRYELDGEEAIDDVYTFSFRPSRSWGEPQIDADGERHAGIELRVPIGIGAYDFDATSPGRTLSLDNAATVTVTPGVEVEIPVNGRWSLKPLVYAGWGTELDGDASAWIYWGGIKSEIRLASGAFDWSIVNALTYVGYSSDRNGRDGVLPLLSGVELSRPLGERRIADHQVHLHWHLAYTRYLEALDLTPASAGRTAEIADEWEIGMAFSTGEQPLRLWRLSWDRVGITYRFGADGEFTGIGLVFQSLFDR